MKRYSVFLFWLFFSLLGTTLTQVQAQTYASVTDVPTSKWDFSIVDLNFNPVTTPAPNTSYYLHLRLNAGVSANVVGYIIQDGDGWYESATQRPQTFPTAKDASTNATNPDRSAYLRFTTVEASDFSGVFFKVRLVGSYNNGVSPVSLPKSKLF
jgi:hypothetical protein